MHISCPDCSNPLKVASESIGETVTCSACGQSFVVCEPGTKPAELVPQVVLEPADDEYGDEEDDEPLSPSFVEAEPVSRPGLQPQSIVFLVAGSFVFLVILIGLSISSRHTLDPDDAPVDLDDGEVSYLEGLAEAQHARELAGYHRLLNKLRDTESEIESLREGDGQNAVGSSGSSESAVNNGSRFKSLTKELSALKAKRDQVEAQVFPNLSPAALMRECLWAKEDLQMAEVALRYPDKKQTEPHAAWQKEQIATLQSQCDKLESLLKTKESSSDPRRWKIGRAKSPDSTFENRTAEERLERFEKLDLDHATALYHQLLKKQQREQSALEPLRQRLHYDFIKQCVIEFGRRLPGDLNEAFLRRTSRGYKEGRALQLSNMNASERESATTKNAADDNRIELSHKLPESVSYIAAKTDLAQQIKAREANVEALRSECERLEANLFPRMSPSVLVSELQDVRMQLQAAEKNQQLETPSIWPSQDELSNIPYDLQAAFCKMIERAEQQKRDVQTSAKNPQNGLPDVSQLDLVVGDFDRQSMSQSKKLAVLRARRDKIEALLKAKGVN
jgi:ribosomal protein S27E